MILVLNLIKIVTWPVMWSIQRMFSVHLRRMCIFLLLDGMFCRFLLGPLFSRGSWTVGRVDRNQFTDHYMVHSWEQSLYAFTQCTSGWDSFWVIRHVELDHSIAPQRHFCLWMDAKWRLGWGSAKTRAVFYNMILTSVLLIFLFRILHLSNLTHSFLFRCVSTVFVLFWY